MVRIFLGNGDRTFKAGQTYPACHAHGLAIGDLNGDNIVDLSTADAGCGQVTILLGNGDGTFRAGGNFATDGNGVFAPYSVAVGDFNSDGKLDLAVANELMNTLSVLLGNGDGTFEAHIDYATVPDSRQVATGDFNGDGRLDLVVSSGSDNEVSVLLGNGDGTFQPQSQYPVNGTDHAFLMVADLNNDGKPDLAVQEISGSVSVLLGNGDGTFRMGGSYPTGGHTASVAAADFNGDGILDLVTPNYYSSNLSLLRGNGDGTFQAPVNYAAGYGARGVAVGDFNGDGRLDLAVGNQFVESISIFLQTVGDTITLAPSSLSFGSQLVNTASSPQTVTLTNTGDALVDISSILASGNFSQTNNCGSTLSAGASCSIAVTFRPRSTCAKTGTLTVTVSGSPQTVKLSGVGTDVTLSTKSVNFGNQAVGTSSAAQIITFTNHSTSRVVPFATVTITGPAVMAFAKSHTCGTSVAPGTSCTITVTFTPHKMGRKTATLNVFDGGGDAPQKVTLSGNGT